MPAPAGLASEPEAREPPQGPGWCCPYHRGKGSPGLLGSGGAIVEFSLERRFPSKGGDQIPRGWEMDRDGSQTIHMDTQQHAGHTGDTCPAQGEQSGLCSLMGSGPAWMGTLGPGRAKSMAALVRPDRGCWTGGPGRPGAVGVLMQDTQLQSRQGHL